MERTVPTLASEEIDLYIRTIYSLLRSTTRVRIRTLEEVHAGINSSLHLLARSQTPDISSFIYANLRLLQLLYEYLHVYVNFFQPVMKMIKKERIDGKTIKVYDEATSPYRRVLTSEDVDFKHKASLSNLYVRLNPVTLRNAIDLNVGKLWKIVK